MQNADLQIKQFFEKQTLSNRHKLREGEKTNIHLLFKCHTFELIAGLRIATKH